MPIPLKDRANGVYTRSTDINDIYSMWTKLGDGYVNNPAIRRISMADAERKRDFGIHEALYFRMGAKLLLMRLILGYTAPDGSYHARLSEESFDNITDFLSRAILVSGESSYNKTEALSSALLSEIKRLRELLAPLVLEVNALYSSSDGEIQDKERAAAAVAMSAKARKTVKEELKLEGLFPESVNMPPLLDTLTEELEDTEERINHDIAAVVEEKLSKLLRAALTEVSFTSAMDFYKEPYDKDRLAASVIAVSSPIEDEALLFAFKLGERFGHKFYKLDASELTTLTDGELSGLFSLLAMRRTSVIVFGFEMLNESARKAAASTVAKEAKEGFFTVFYDKSGAKSVYDFLSRVFTDCDISLLKLAHLYLKMPSFSSVSELLFEEEVLTDSEQARAEIRDGIPFAGFAGLNRALSLSGGVFEYLKEISRVNTPACMHYLTELQAQRHFIDSGFGDFSEYTRFSRGKRVKFDYDGIREADVENVRKIISATGVSMFSRVGMLVRYLTLAGDDVSVWSSLDLKEKEARITDATRVIARLLCCGYVPEISVIPKDKWPHKKSWVGVCIGDGKKIDYREDHADDYDGIIKTICHEVYHAFQHTTMSGGYLDWYFSELGVTEGKIEEWTYTDTLYDSNNNKVYTVHVLEADARAFANDCITESGRGWHKIDFN